MIFGVCRGVSDYYGVNLFWTRVLFVIGASMTTFWLVGAYTVAALVMKLEPVLPLETAEDEEFYHSYTASRGMALSRLKRTFDNLDRRIQRLETTVITREYDWERRLND
jgi:phage shock protein C